MITHCNDNVSGPLTRETGKDLSDRLGMNEPLAVVVQCTLFSIVSIVNFGGSDSSGFSCFHACVVQFSLNLFDSEQEHAAEFCL